MAKTLIFPAAIRYQGELAATCASLKAVGYTFDTDTLDKITAMLKNLQDGIAKLEKQLAAPAGKTELEHCATRSSPQWQRCARPATHLKAW
jgi:glutamine synthetase